MVRQKLDEAASRVRALSERFAAVVGSSHPRTVRIGLLWAEVLKVRERHAEAEEKLRATYEAARIDARPWVAKKIAELYEGWGRSVQAKRWRATAEDDARGQGDRDGFVLGMPERLDLEPVPNP